MKPFAELEVVRLRQAQPVYNLPAGAQGTIVLVHAQGEAYEVEFVQPNGFTQAVLTLSAADLATPATQVVGQAA